MKNTLIFLIACFSLLSSKPVYSQLKDTLVLVPISKIRKANQIYYENETNKERLKLCGDYRQQDSLRIVNFKKLIVSYQTDSINHKKELKQHTEVVSGKEDLLTEKDQLISKLRKQKVGLGGLSVLFLVLLIL